MIPTIERHFDAIHLIHTTKTKRLNRTRLLAAIDLLNQRDGKAAATLHERFPLMSPADVYDHLAAAQQCIDYDLKP
ncbi:MULTISPECIES: hypothetical protein [unclassified Micromonospora]|uniref:hypothetical protein n=1 Tax=unclassified Micromonospora TaxID=2617518 RepID=UPI0033300959